MGLSDRERREKLIWAVYRMTRAGRELKSHEDRPGMGGLKRLRKLTRKLWHAYLGRVSNGAYWIFGGDADNEIREAGAPWATAVIYHCAKQRDRRERDSDSYYEATSVYGQIKDYGLATVYKIYSDSEAATYALRRYDDAFKAEYAALSALISDIQGACFEVFANHREFAEAYLRSKLATAIYQFPRSEALAAVDAHHGLSHVKDLNALLELDKGWAQSKKTHTDAMVLYARLCRPFSFRWAWPKIKEKLAEEGLEVDFAQVEEAAKIAEAAEKREKAEKDGVSRNQSAQWRAERESDVNYALHGSESWDWGEE